MERTLCKCDVRGWKDGGEHLSVVVRFCRHDVRVGEVPVPKITDPGDVVIRVTASGICGSDLHLYNGTMPGMKPGDILGHEPMGVVEEVGPEVATLQPGDRVVVAFDLGCGKCLYCKEVRNEMTRLCVWFEFLLFSQSN